MPFSYRIVKRRWAENAFDGKGARIVGGRWNSPGTPMVYTSESIALAAMEILVHIERTDILGAYVIFTCEFDQGLVSGVGELPWNWNASPIPSTVQAIGDRWVYGASSPVLRVPSVVIAEEHNYLLNPDHRFFDRITISPPRPFEFDGRLVH